jgi:hypothetical protein
MRPDGVGLKHHADLASLRRHKGAVSGAIHGAVVDHDLAGHRLFEPGDAAQRRRLPQRRWAEERKQPPLANCERDAVEGAHLALRAGEGFDQIFNAYHNLS